MQTLSERLPFTPDLLSRMACRLALIRSTVYIRPQTGLNLLLQIRDDHVPCAVHRLFTVPTAQLQIRAASRRIAQYQHQDQHLAVMGRKPVDGRLYLAAHHVVSWLAGTDNTGRRNPRHPLFTLALARLGEEGIAHDRKKPCPKHRSGPEGTYIGQRLCQGLLDRSSASLALRVSERAIGPQMRYKRHHILDCLAIVPVLLCMPDNAR